MNISDNLKKRGKEIKKKKKPVKETDLTNKIREALVLQMLKDFKYVE